ncbi:MAG: thioredoxin [Geminicoccaceae bacterium]
MVSLFGSGTKPKPAATGPIKDGSIETFAEDVIKGSQKVPVLVDFWAPWCGPCKQLTPVLEKLVNEFKGKIQLVKINVDENQELAAQLRVQSIPTVFAFLGGQPVTAFAGAQPESQIRKLIEQLVGGPIQAEADGFTVADAKAAEAQGQYELATQMFQTLYEESPEDPQVIGGLARCLIAGSRMDEASRLLDAVPADKKNHVDIDSARASLEIAKSAGTLRDPALLLARLDGTPDDHAARHELAMAMFLRGQVETAMDELMHIVKADREWNDDQARKTLIRFFEALGPAHPETVKGRRKLSTVLFS